MPNSYMNLKSCFHFYYVIDVGSVFSGLVFVLHAPACVRSLYGYFHCVVAVLAVYGVDCGGKSGLLSAVDSVEKVALNCAGGADVPDYHARFLVEKRGGRVPLRAQRADSTDTSSRRSFVGTVRVTVRLIALHGASVRKRLV